jgi:hypothetical protein
MSVLLTTYGLSGQIMKLLSAMGYVLEEGVQTFKPSPLTMAMADPILEATTRAWYVSLTGTYGSVKSR